MKNKKIIPTSPWKNYLIFFFIIFYLLINILFLKDFPYIHSDEAWLSGLSRVFINTLQMDYTFFDLFPTTHHTMKIFFILIQSLFIKTLGYSIFSLRLISIIFSAASLILFYKILLFYNKKEVLSLLFTLLLSLNLQWLVSGHLARQESILIFLFLLAYLVLIKKPKYEVIILATILGFGIGIHPNIFFLAIALGMTYLYQWYTKKRKFTDLIQLIALTALYAAIYLISTIYINGDFLTQYTAYGNKLGVFNALASKFKDFYFFYYKLYHRISGTYFTVPLKYDYFAFIVLIFVLIYCFFKKNTKNENEVKYPSILFFISMNLGILILGRYNQISVIFPIIFLYLSLAIYGSLIFKNKKILIYFLSILILFQGYHSFNFINQVNNESYSAFLKEFSVIQEEGKILGNLNLEYAFKDRLMDYRNLTHLEDYSISFEDYIDKNNIKYIVWYEEMDYIYRNQPKWDILYGPLNYYDAVTAYIETETQLIKTFQSPTYAMRIAKYVNTYPWEVKIYEVNFSP